MVQVEQQKYRVRRSGAVSPLHRGAEVKGQWWKETHIQDLQLIRPPVEKHPVENQI